MSDLIDNPAKLYVKKPVVVEAVLLDADNLEQVMEWVGDSLTGGGQGNVAYVDIHTLEGSMQAREGDYIIKGIKGEFYPCRADIFQATYTAKETLSNSDGSDLAGSTDAK